MSRSRYDWQLSENTPTCSSRMQRRPIKGEFWQLCQTQPRLSLDWVLRVSGFCKFEHVSHIICTLFAFYFQYICTLHIFWYNVNWYQVYDEKARDRMRKREIEWDSTKLHKIVQDCTRSHNITQVPEYNSLSGNITRCVTLHCRFFSGSGEGGGDWDPEGVGGKHA